MDKQFFQTDRHFFLETERLIFRKTDRETEETETIFRQRDRWTGTFFRQTQTLKDRHSFLGETDISNSTQI